MRKFFALLLTVFIFSPMAAGAMALVGINSWLFNRDFYTDIAGSEALYGALLSEEMPAYLNREVPAADGIPPAALGAGLREVLNAGYLRDQAVTIVNELFDALEGKDYTLYIAVDLIPIKEALRGDGGGDFARAYAAKLPACEEGQAPVDEGERLPRCVPPDMSAEMVIDDVYQALPALIEDAPDRFELMREPVDLRAELNQASWMLGGSLQTGLNAAALMIAVPAAAVWLLASLVSSDNWRGRLIWMGISLLLPTGLIFGLGVMTNGDLLMLPVRAGVGTLEMMGREASPATQDAFIDVAQDALNRISSGFNVVAVVVGAVGLILIGIGILVRPAPQEGGPPEKPKRQAP